MNIEGVWTGEILGPYEWENSGVYILESGRIIGGNNRHYSHGTYEVDGEQYHAHVHVHYYGPPRAIFSEIKSDFRIIVRGKVTDESLIEAEIVRSDRPHPTVVYRMTKRMDLPST